MRKIIFLFTILIILSFLFLPRMGFTQGLFVRDPDAGVSETCQVTGNCTLDEFVNFIIFRGQVLFPGAGTFALIMFVVGGIYWVISAGSPDKVERGKKIMIGAVVGMVIMFAAWLGIKVLQDMLGVEDWARPAGMEQSEGGETIEGADCGDNMIIYNGICVTECAATKGSGWSCQNPSGKTGCQAGLCPGGGDNICCPNN